MKSATALIPTAEMVDLAAERARLEKELAAARSDLERCDSKLGNQNFVAKAPREVVEAEQTKRNKAALLVQSLTDAINSLQ